MNLWIVFLIVVVVIVVIVDVVVVLTNCIAELASMLYRDVCIRINHLLQHIPKPTSAEALAAAFADVGGVRNAVQRGSGPSLVDPTRARAQKDGTTAD